MAHEQVYQVATAPACDHRQAALPLRSPARPRKPRREERFEDPEKRQLLSKTFGGAEFQLSPNTAGTFAFVVRGQRAGTYDSPLHLNSHSQSSQQPPSRHLPTSLQRRATLTPAAMLSPRPTRAITHRPRRRTQEFKTGPIPSAMPQPQPPFSSPGPPHKKRKIKKCTFNPIQISDNSRLKTKTRAAVHNGPNPINGHSTPPPLGGIPECRATL